MFKESFANKGRVLFIAGLAMLFLSGVLWYANGGWMKFKKASADYDPNISGDFKETWTADEVLGNPRGFTANSDSTVAIVAKHFHSDTQCAFISGATSDDFNYYAVPGSSASNCTTSSEGMLVADPGNLSVVKWSVYGHMNP